MESSSRGRRRGIGEEPIAKGSLVRVMVKEVRRANVVVNGDGGAYGSKMAMSDELKSHV